MRKGRIIGIVLACLVVLSFVSYFILYPPNKVIDPSQPGFLEKDFRLRDYDDFSLAHALKVLFPKGTPKEYVDLMLVKRGGAIVASQEYYAKGSFIYAYKHIRAKLSLIPDSWLIRVYYDEDKKLVSINFGRFLIDKDYKPTLVQENAK